jgi:cytochrome c553
MKTAFVLALVLATTSTLATANNIAEGEKKSVTCAACHGKAGNEPIDPSYPKLAGQHEDFLLRALKDYKSGKRKNAIMGGQAAALTNTDMANLAAYYAAQAGSLKTTK